MKRTVARVLIVAVLVSQMVWIVMPRRGGQPSPRLLQALRATQLSPKSEQDAAIAKEEAEDGVEEGRRAVVLLAACRT